MKEHSLRAEEDIKALIPHHLAFQREVARVANLALGFQENAHIAIRKFEGGVRAGGHEIAILRDRVEDVFNHKPEATKEEIAVATAIDEVNKRFKAGEALPNPDRGLLGDPLRHLFRLRAA